MIIGKKLPHVLLFVFIVSFQYSYSQSYSVSGRVADQSTGLPLQNANVYINNSSKGTITNSEGFFSLSGLAQGKYELIISYVGFQTTVKTLELTTENLQVIIQLDKKERLLREVMIIDNETRRRYLEIFKANVLGYTKAARRSTIRNLDAVEFTAGTAKGDLFAYAEDVLVIENPETGYIIHFQLTDFYFNTNTGATYFFGYLRFEDLATGGSASRKWINKRNDHYYGSTMHFYRSLVAKQLKSEGYRLTVRRQLFVEDPKRKQFVLRVVPVELTEDSMLFLYSDSIYKIFEMRFEGPLTIIYKKNTQLKKEMQESRPSYGQPATGTCTGLRVKEKPVLIDYRGLLLTPMNLYYDGIWAYERLANMLPEDFVPVDK